MKIQDYEPFDLDMNSAFTINEGRLVFSHINLDTGGTRTRLVGDANLAYFPEQMYRMESEIDFPWMRKIFFAKDNFELSGKGTFSGTFHLFRETMPGGRIRTGRELKGTFKSHTAGLNTLRFGDLRGTVKWVPEFVEVSDTTSRFYGGQLALGYRMAPLGTPGVTATYTFDAAYRDIDLTAFSDYLEMQGLRLAGTGLGPQPSGMAARPLRGPQRRGRDRGDDRPRAPSCRRGRSRWRASRRRRRRASRSGPSAITGRWSRCRSAAA